MQHQLEKWKLAASLFSSVANSLATCNNFYPMIAKLTRLVPLAMLADGLPPMTGHEFLNPFKAG